MRFHKIPGDTQQVFGLVLMLLRYTVTLGYLAKGCIRQSRDLRIVKFMPCYLPPTDLDKIKMTEEVNIRNLAGKRL